MVPRFERQRFFTNLKILCETFGVQISVEELWNGTPELVFEFPDGEQISSERKFSAETAKKIIDDL
jgi:hypothetical protein